MSRADTLIDAVEHLHSCPLVVSRILQLLRNPDFKVGELENQLKADPALAAQTLKLVNSSRFGLSRRICSIRQAITYLGARALRLAVLSFGLVDRLTKGAPVVLLKDYWRRALTTASVAAYLCPRQDSIHPDEAYAAGLFADVGVLFLAQVETERYVMLHQQCGHGKELVAAEQQEFGASHAELGARLLRRWNFPERLTVALERHHDEDSRGDLLCSLLLAGDMLADALWTPQTPRMMQIQRFLHSQFNLDLDGLFSLAVACNRSILENADVFRVDLHGGIDCEALREHALHQHQLDAMDTAMMCDAMLAAAQHDGGSAPPANSRVVSFEDRTSSLGSADPNCSTGDGETLVWKFSRTKDHRPDQSPIVRAGNSEEGVFGKYVVLEKLGQGGMGVVLKARHQCMDRTVAVKVLSQSAVQSPESIQRFYQEVKAAAQLKHPNIVTAYDAGEHEGAHYLVMEFIAGKDCARIVQEQGPLAVEEALGYVMQAARGLDYAHRHGIIHRDIKPANLLLDDEGTVKILDMGLARLTAGVGDEVGPELTCTGQIMGTVDFLSPEQAEDARHVDHRTDVYSLGCTLYYLLTGRPVYEADTVMRKLLAHRTRAIPSVCAFRPEAPKGLDGVFCRMVAKRPEDRWESMATVMDELQEVAAGERFRGVARS